MSQPITFTLGTMTDAGMVTLSAPGRDLIRAIVYKWLEECEKSHEEAKEWDKAIPGGKYRGQMDYWRNARSFLAGKLCNNLPLQFNAGKYLPRIAKWPAGTMAPERWAADLFHSLAQVPPDVSAIPTDGRSGEGGDGVHGDDPVATGLGGPVAAGDDQQHPPDGHPSADGRDSIPHTERAGADATEHAGGRGGSRNSAGTPDHDGRKATPVRKRSATTPRNRKPGRK